jgi:hypothetical protein
MFSYGNEWAGDQIYPSRVNDVFITQPPARKASVNTLAKSDTDGYPSISEHVLVVMLLIILIVMCTMIHSSMKQTQEMIKVLIELHKK